MKYFVLLAGEERQMCNDCAEAFLKTNHLIEIAKTEDGDPLLMLSPRTCMEELRALAKARHPTGT